jgi:multiple antibiotic resistance protein
LAFQGTLIAAIGVLVAGTLGAHVLQKWGISIGALEVTTGLILFLIALQPLLREYERRHTQENEPELAGVAASASALAFSPLAFPTIVTPYGIAILVMVVTVRAGHPDIVAQIWGVTAVILALDLAAMLCADSVLRAPYVASIFGILGAVLGVLQVALGVQAIVVGLRLLGFAGGSVTPS